MDAVVVPRLQVDRVDAAQLDLAALDLVRARAAFAYVLELLDGWGRGGYAHARPPPVAEPQKLHRTPEVRAEPLHVIAVHGAFACQGFRGAGYYTIPLRARRPAVRARRTRGVPRSRSDRDDALAPPPERS